jgi:hypothetical protein
MNQAGLRCDIVILSPNDVVCQVKYTAFDEPNVSRPCVFPEGSTQSGSAQKEPARQVQVTSEAGNDMDPEAPSELLVEMVRAASLKHGELSF